MFMNIKRSISVIIQDIVALIVILVLITACNQSESSSQPEVYGDEELTVAATTSIVGDLVKQVVGENVNVEVILPTGTDPHSFDPTPQDVAKLVMSEILFMNGAGLENFLDPLIESSGGDLRIIDLSQEVQLIQTDDIHDGENNSNSSNYDPHIWMDPNNAILWIRKISDVIVKIDPDNSSFYERNAREYIDKLEDLDTWIRDRVEQVPPDQRKIVTDHLVFGYFVKAYGFEQVGAVIPTLSTLSQPSAQELAALEDVIHEEEIKAIFVGESVNPDLSRRVAEDTGIELVFVHTGSLTEKGGIADNYIDLIRYNVTAFVNALR